MKSLDEWHLIFKGYPSTAFWIAACATFAAGTKGAYALLGAILVVELFIVVRVVRNTPRVGGNSARSKQR